MAFEAPKVFAGYRKGEEVEAISGKEGEEAP